MILIASSAYLISARGRFYSNPLPPAARPQPRSPPRWHPPATVPQTAHWAAGDCHHAQPCGFEIGQGLEGVRGDSSVGGEGVVDVGEDAANALQRRRGALSKVLHSKYCFHDGLFYSDVPKPTDHSNHHRKG